MTDDKGLEVGELPSISSSTSISDNVALRNYYDKLLFKNSSGKSLTDLPRKGREEAMRERRVDFVSGLSGATGVSGVGSVGMTPSASEPLQAPMFQLGENGAAMTGLGTSLGALHSGGIGAAGPDRGFATQQNMQFTFMPAAGARQNSIASTGSSGSTTIASPTNYYAALSPVNSVGALGYPATAAADQQYAAARRSSYISDTLIHGQMASHPGSHITPQGADFNSGPFIQPGMEYSFHSTGPPTMQGGPGHSYASKNRYLNFPQRHQSVPKVNLKMPTAGPYGTPSLNHATASLDNSLILVNGQQIVASPELKALYKECGSKYFSSSQACDFVDSSKVMLAGDTSNGVASHIARFLAFLKSCNLNYNPQSEAFVSGNEARKSGSASTYLHYKPLVLVALKNGKLELLSIPQSTNLLMTRNDMVVIDGDRGKDLALVVEPQVDLDLALFINFLKKKIHFDSLITNRNQHYPNNQFVKALMDSTRGQGDELNSKLYDVIELTQLIIPSKQVLRFATSWEATTNLHNKFQDELKALHIAQLKLKSLNSGLSHHQHQAPRAQLNIKILNAEFQFDRKKLTFYYVCQERNDFRELIKELFKFYKTRIWLCAIPNNLEIDTKYYDNQLKELKMYQEMMQHCPGEELLDNGGGSGFIVAPALSSIELDNFQIGVYKELVNQLFS
ncbi:LAMI_0F01530g1_1 [Lachancea mirantina]|uniref:LAMI_0F01530g1_1 n=1 Tax=Lachancea mirantina TaxID=1230905 RepID=A0A1G4JW65_9SACH|nr:LAMI_0F01530g1_1 [Lachancea mirantina]